MDTKLPQQLVTWLQNRPVPCHRSLVVISGDSQWVQAQAEAMLETLDSTNVLWMGERTHQSAAAPATPSNSGLEIPVARYRQFLGQEFNHVVYNAFSGTRGNALIALSGSVKSNGCMLLLCPRLQEWPDTVLPEAYKRSFSNASNPEPSYFLQWLCKQILADQKVALVSPEELRLPPHAVPQGEDLRPLNSSNDQQDAIEGILRVAKGHRNRPLVITADRGRGKSSALGLAAARLISEEGKHIIITAPHKAMTQKAFEHAAQSLSVCGSSDSELLHKNGSVRFIAMDRLLAERPNADIVLVDEAAAFPNVLLEGVSTHYSRVVYSTTIHGYEGSGRGFELRFKDYLTKHKPQWRSLHLNIPMRWYQGDNLETFWFRVFCMNSDSNTPKQDPHIDSAKSSCTTNAYSGSVDQIALCSSRSLIEDPELMCEMFNLLVNAHYQTTPDDLVRILDAPEQQVYCLTRHNNVLGVALTSDEGGNDLTDLAYAISAGKRRVNGHLSAQALAYTFANPHLAIARYRRIVRIAVHNNVRRSGLGSLLIAHIRTQAFTDNIHYLSTSFGLTRRLIDFWHKNHFEAAKLGLKADASSGELSLLMLSGCDKPPAAIQAINEQCIRQAIYHAVNSPYLATSALAAMLLHTNYSAGCSAAERVMIEQFANGTRPLESVQHVIPQWLLNFSVELTRQQQEAYEYLTALTVQRLETVEMKQTYALTGRKMIEQYARDSVSLLIGQALN